MKYVLALDISTRIIGVCVLDTCGKIRYYDHINLSKIDTFFGKIDCARKALQTLHNNLNCDIAFVCVEDYARKFQPGRSSANTIIKLASFNNIVSYFAREQFGIEPTFYPVRTARKLCKIKVKRGQNAKLIVCDSVVTMMKKNEEKYEFKYTKNGNLKDYEFDRADAYVLAMAKVIEMRE